MASIQAANSSRYIGHDSFLLPDKSVWNFWSDGQYNVYWKGLVFVSGILSGSDSVKAFVAEMEEKGIESACSILKGTYFFVIESKKKGVIHAFIDNSGLYHAYCTPEKVSTSFLGLAESQGLTAADFDPGAVVEFLHFGSMLTGGTYLPSIRRIGKDDVLRIQQSHQQITFIKKKGARTLADPENPSKPFAQHFTEMAASLRNCRVSVDLTGGADTRLVAAMLDRCGLQFETASSGGVQEYEDISISKQVAEVMGRPWFGTIHSASTFEDDVEDMFEATDGLYDLVYYHRLYQLQKDRRKRGIDTIVSGVGGELFKDFWWLHEFPFYSRGTSSIDRFVKMRIMSFEPMHGILSEKFEPSSRGLKHNLAKAFSVYVMDTNTKTFDNIFYNVLMGNVAGRIMTSHTHFVNCLAPFLDTGLARMGFKLDRTRRVYNIFHRTELTKINPALARLRTSENGISVSSRPADMIYDLPAYINEKIKRVLIKLGASKSKKASLRNAPVFYSKVRQTRVMNQAFETLKANGIINKKAEASQVEDKYLGAFLALGMVAARLDRHKKRTALN
ncbi:MAG: asparagine synthase-related protein [Nitrospiraceae bacterium]|nr:asparagine synthase-related protein [Nitrospiraceae bacterium]